MVSNKIIALGKEITLLPPVEVTRENVLSLLKDLDGSVAVQLENVEFSIRIEGEATVIYRDSAVFG